MTDDLDPERLRRLQDAVAALPRSIEPQRDAWPAIRDRIEAKRVRAIAKVAPGTARGTAAPTSKRRVAWLAAAALVLVTVSSGVTVLVLGRVTGRDVVLERVRVVPPVVDSTPAAGRPPSARVARASVPPIDAVFSHYDAAASDLASALDARRGRLDPRTLAVLDSCIRRIDAAIAEARSALRRDPKDAVITGLLTVSYNQKLDLLKRAAELPLGSFQD